MLIETEIFYKKVFLAGQTLLKHAEKENVIERKDGESEHGQFPPVYNIITTKGK
jgi:hypothetical protein